MELFESDILSTGAARIAAAPLMVRGVKLFEQVRPHMYAGIEEVWRPLLDQWYEDIDEKHAELREAAKAGDEEAQSRLNVLELLGAVKAVHPPFFVSAVHHCRHCGTEFVCGHASIAYCSNRCQSAHHTVRMREYMRENRPSRAKTHDPIPCAHCGTEFTPKRKDAKFCGGKCRVRHHRAAVTRT